MKRFILFLFFSFFLKFSFSQQVVTAPVAEQQLAAITAMQTSANSILDFIALTAAKEEVRNAARFASSAFNITASLISIGKLTENLICMTDELKVLVQLNVHYESCLFQVHYDKIMVNLDISIDMLKAYFVGAAVISALDADKGMALFECERSLSQAVRNIQMLNEFLKWNVGQKAFRAFKSNLNRRHAFTMARGRASVYYDPNKHILFK